MTGVPGWLRAKVEGFAFDRVSSRSLGLVRILVALDIIYEFASPWVSHRVDHDFTVLFLTWGVFLANWFVLVGYKTRVATAVWWGCFAVLHFYYGRYLLDDRFHATILVFQVMTVLTFAPSGRSLSIDRALELRRARREGRPPALEQIPFWVLDLLAVEISAIYLWAGLDKTDAAWLNGERMEHYFMFWYGSSDTLQRLPWVHYVAVITAWATTIIELGLAVGLIFRRTRHWVVWGGFALHIGILFYFSITYFSMMMMTVLLACLRPEWIHDFISLIGEGPGPEPAAAPEPD